MKRKAPKRPGRTKRPKYKRTFDRKMRDYGEIDFEKKRIRVNPRHGGLLNTIIHEDIHRRHPRMTEKNVVKRSKIEEKRITPSKLLRLVKPYVGP